MSVVTRPIEAQHDYGRTLKAWLSPPPSDDALTPDERHILTHLEAALDSGSDTGLGPWGGFREARLLALRLRERAGRAHSTSRPRIDSYSTHHAARLAPD